jgi:threonine aldolase
MLHEPDANMIFAKWPRSIHQKLQAAGAKYYVMDGPLDSGDPDTPLSARLVCDWSVGTEAIDQFLSYF